MANSLDLNSLTPEQLVTESRLEKIRFVAANRQPGFTIILENVHDPHNIGAVLRTCDSVGIEEIYCIYSIESKTILEGILGHRSSSGSKKWVDVHVFESAEACFKEVRKKYDKIFGTHLSEDAHSLYDLQLTENVALLFGNEHRGVSPEALELIDGNFIIPQFGMVQSLNISVACAVSLYEGLRQRQVAGMYDGQYNPTSEKHLSYEKKYAVLSRQWHRKG